MCCKQDDGVIPGRAFTVFCSWLGPQSTGKSSYYQFPPASRDGFAASSQKKTDLGKVLAGVYEEKEAQKEDLDFFHEIGKGAEGLAQFLVIILISSDSCTALSHPEVPRPAGRAQLGEGAIGRDLNE